MRKENLKAFYHFTVSVGIAVLALCVLGGCLLLFWNEQFGGCFRFILLLALIGFVLYGAVSGIVSHILFKKETKHQEKGEKQ